MVRSLELARQGELLRGAGEGLRRVPELTEAMRLALAAIEIAGCRPLSEQRFRFPGDNGEYEVSAVVLQRLIRKGLIEVMGLGPAVYRVTKLGRLARSMR